jgi:hypothetical protein
MRLDFFLNELRCHFQRGEMKNDCQFYQITATARRLFLIFIVSCLMII